MFKIKNSNWATQEVLQQKLTDILEYRNIQCSNAEIRSYTVKELCQLISKYRIKLNIKKY